MLSPRQLSLYLLPTTLSRNCWLAGPHVAELVLALLSLCHQSGRILVIVLLLSPLTILNLKLNISSLRIILTVRAEYHQAEWPDHLCTNLAARNLPFFIWQKYNSVYEFSHSQSSSCFAYSPKLATEASPELSRRCKYQYENRKH